METITYYSYKGGTGRTLLLANTAAFLASAGNRVVMLDFDLEAPGLHSKFNRKVPDRIDDFVVLGREDIAPGEIGPGSVELLSRWQYGKSVDLDEILYEVTPDALGSVGAFGAVRGAGGKKSEEAGGPLKAKGSGEVWLIPAGPAPSHLYATSVQGLDWSKIGEVSARRVRQLKAMLETDYNVDFLLIDARTGITDIGSLALYDMAEKAVCLFTMTPESIEGAALVMDGLFESLGRDNVIPALSRTPEDRLGDREWLQEACNQLNLAGGWSTAVPEGGGGDEEISPEGIVVIRSDPKLQAREEIIIGSRRRLREAMITLDYLDLFKRLRLPSDIFTAKERNLLSLYSQQPASMITDQVADDRNIQGEIARYGFVYSEPRPRAPDTYRRFIETLRERLVSAIDKVADSRRLRLPFDLMALRMHEGTFHFCSDPYFLSPSRKQLVGVLPLGRVSEFGCVLEPAGPGESFRGEIEAAPEFKNAKALLDGLAAERSFALLGETTASSEALPYLTSWYRHHQIYVAASLSALKERISREEFIVILADLDMLQALGYDEPHLRFRFSAGDVGGHLAGLMYPLGDSAWRCLLSEALARSLEVLAVESGETLRETWRRISASLVEIGMKPLSGIEILREILIDMEANSAVSWHQRLIGLSEDSVAITREDVNQETKGR